MRDARYRVSLERVRAVIAPTPDRGFWLSLTFPEPDSVAAWSVWNDGRFLSADFGFEVSERKSAYRARVAVERRALADSRPPDLILLYGASRSSTPC